MILKLFSSSVPVELHGPIDIHHLCPHHGEARHGRQPRHHIGRGHCPVHGPPHAPRPPGDSVDQTAELPQIPHSHNVLCGS